MIGEFPLTPAGRSIAAADFLLCCVVTAATCAIYLSGLGGSFALNSDIVMPYVVYADAVAGNHALSGWIFPESPYWFPDLLVTWAAYAGTSLLTAVNIVAFLQIAGYLLLARWVLALIEPRCGRAAWMAFMLLWLAASLLGMHVHDSWFDRFGHFLFVPYTHAGSLLVTLASLGLLLSMQRYPQRIFPLVALIALAIPTLMSDRLYAVTCVLPILTIVALPLLRAPVRMRAGAAMALVLIGSESWRWFTGVAATTSRYAPVNPPARAFAQMMNDFETVLYSSAWATALMLAGGVALVLSLEQAWRRRHIVRTHVDSNAAAIATVFIASSIALPLVAGVALGRHTAIDSFRYCQTFEFVLLPLAWLLARTFRRGSEKRASWAMAGAVALGVAIAAFNSDISEAALHAEWRAQADCIDSAHARYGLHNGLSRYWHANSLNAQMHSGSSIFALSADFESTPINKNIDWIGARAERAEQLPILDFIDEFQFDAARLDETFGTPIARIECPLSTVRVYAPAAGVLGVLYRKNDWLPQDTIANHGRMAVPAAAWMQAPARADNDGLRVVGTFSEHTPVLVGGMELPRPGTHVWIDYRLDRASDAEVRWEAVALDAQGSPVEVLAGGALDPETTSTHRVIDLPRPRLNAHGIGFSVAVLGQVDLRVRAVGMTLE